MSDNGTVATSSKCKWRCSTRAIVVTAVAVIGVSIIYMAYYARLMQMYTVMPVPFRHRRLSSGYLDLVQQLEFGVDNLQKNAVYQIE